MSSTDLLCSTEPPLCSTEPPLCSTNSKVVFTGKRKYEENKCLLNFEICLEVIYYIRSNAEKFGNVKKNLTINNFCNLGSSPNS